MELPAALISMLLYESLVIPSFFFGLSLLHMQPGIIAGDEVKHNLRHDAILSSALSPSITSDYLAMLMGPALRSHW